MLRGSADVISIDRHCPLERDGTVRLFSVSRTGRWIKTSELEILRKVGRIGRASSTVLEITEPAQLAGSGSGYKRNGWNGYEQVV